MTDFDRLEAALDQLHQCILVADFSELPKILAETEYLSAALVTLPNRSVAERIRYKASRNGQCLQASARGLRAAQRRLVEVSTASTRLSTYTSHGLRAEISTCPAALALRI